MFKLALKNLWAYKRRLLTSAFAVVLGVSFLAGSFVFTDSMRGVFNDMVSSFAKGVDAQVAAKPGFGDGASEDFGSTAAMISDSLVAKVRAIPEVEVAEPSLVGYAQVVNKKGKLVTTGGAPTLGAVWSDDKALNTYVLNRGRAPQADDEVVFDMGLVKSTGFKVGDKVKVNTVKGVRDYTLVGGATFGSSDSAMSSTLTFFTLAEGQRVLAEPGQIQAVAARAKAGVSEEQLVAKMQSALVGEKAVNGAELEYKTGAQLDTDARKIIDTIFKYINYFFTAFAVVALFVSIFVISNSFSILIAQRTRELARLRILGASRTQIVGSTFAESLGVGVVASALGVIGGLIVALAIRALLNQFGGGSLPSAGLRLLPRTIVIGMLIGTTVTVLASVIPVIKAASVKPLEALRDSQIDHSATSRKRRLIGLLTVLASAAVLMIGLNGKGGTAARNVGIAAALALIAAVLLGPTIARPVAGFFGRRWFGVIIAIFGGILALAGVASAILGIAAGSPLVLPVGALLVFIGWYLIKTAREAFTTAGHLARQNAIRNPNRTSATALALTIGTALVSALLVFSTSLTDTLRGEMAKTVKADYFVTSAGTGFPKDASAAMASVPGVVAQSAVRGEQFRIGFPARTRMVTAIEPSHIEELIDLGKIEGAMTDLAKPDTVALSKEVAEKNNYKIGSTIKATFTSGAKPTFTVVAIFEKDDGLVFGRGYVVSLATLRPLQSASAMDYIMYVKSDAGSKAEHDTFQKAGDKALEAFPSAELKTKSKVINERVGQLNQFLALINALLALAIIIAILGIANTLKLSIHERTREIGLVRAVGMSRSQIRGSIRWEAIVVATLGSAIGVALGTGFGAALVYVLGKSETVKLTVPVPWMVILLLLASIVGLLAARKPAKTAAKMNILEAIASE